MVQRAERNGAAQWAQIVAEFDSSTDTERSFCERRGLLLVTFHKWFRITKGLSKPRARRRRPSPPRFVQVAMPTQAPPIGQMLTLHAGDVRIECPAGMGIDSVARLVRAVRHDH